nr:hypothetical transcript [Hymenolepis microstoma]
MTERPLSPEEEWLQESEARLESMEVLLKSVRRDIDALSEKIPSPHSGLRKAFRTEPVIHESGSKDYILRIEGRPKAYQNLGLGSHTSLEPFDDDDDLDRPVNDVSFQKSWRSPSDLRNEDSPPGSPTFGESSKIISLNDVILDLEKDSYLLHDETEEIQERGVPLKGSLHSLPTIEENSQEDNTDTSISTSEDMNSTDCSYTQPAIGASCDTIISLPSKQLPGEMMIERSGSAHFTLNKSRSDYSEGLRFSRTSLKSRESMISESDSFVTVNSQIFPSAEEAYVTAYSDTDELGESNDEDTSSQCEGFVRRNKVLVLQKTPSADGETDSEDILEFTFVEATPSNPPCIKNGTLISPESSKAVNSANNFGKRPVKRRALRRRQPEEENSSEEDDFDDLDTSSSSTCEEAVYDTGTGSVMNPNSVVFCYEGPPRPIQLSCIEEASCLSNSLDSPTGQEDIVIHYNDDEIDEINDNKSGDEVLMESNEIQMESSPKSNNVEGKLIDNGNGQKLISTHINT